MNVNLRPLAKPQSIRDHVTRVLRAAILSGEMEPGQVYSAPTLGARLGVSPTPVREAMLDLVKDGLVVMVRNKGFRVTEVDDRYLDEITELRQLIEPPLVRDAVALIPEADRPRLRELAEAIVTHAAARDLVEYTEADKAFHLALLRYTGNERILRLVEDLRDHARLIGLSQLAERGELAASAREHVAIIDAIEAGDADLTYRLMVDHIRKTRGAWAGQEDTPTPAFTH
ncbi:MAG TPA: GntR family transcriptional regulator [Ilumatobacter sp.]|nr:GntR family transcriptional regulator [Ilumatobacter sp.]